MAAPLQLILPDGPTDLAVGPGDEQLTLAELLSRRGHPLNTRCGGRGLCGGCEVEWQGESREDIGKIIITDNVSI